MCFFLFIHTYIHSFVHAYIFVVDGATQRSERVYAIQVGWWFF